MSSSELPDSVVDDVAAAAATEASVPLSLKDELYLCSVKDDLARAKDILQRWISQDIPLTPDDLTRALDMALMYGHISVAQLLLDHGAAITVSTTAAATYDNPTSLAGFKALVQHGWRVDSITNPVAKNLAMNSIMSNHNGESLLEYLLSEGAPVNGLPTNPGSPLRWAPNSAIAKILLSHGATLKHTSALHAAAAKYVQADSIALMNLYLDNGVDINELLFEGRPVTGRRNGDNDYGTALHYAAREGSKLAARAGLPEGGLERLKLLVERGADVAKLSTDGQTARDWAQLWQRQPEKEYLEEVMTARGIPFEDVVISEDSGDEHYSDDYPMTLRLCADIR